MSESFERRLHLPVSPDEAFAWHERPGALPRLIPPWESIEVGRHEGGIRDGAVVELVQHVGPVKVKWIARHHDYQAGKSFRDTQVSGPFQSWEHLHQFLPHEAGGVTLTDHVDYQPPGGMMGRLFGGPLIRRKIEAMFAYRHNTTRADLAAHAKHKERGVMNIAVSGSSGLVGASLAPMLTTGGHEVIRLVRDKAGQGEVSWDPQGEAFDASPLDGIDAVVHLAGKSIASARWSDQVKQQIRDSRVHGTRILCEGLAKMANPPKTLVCASAVGVYGDRGDEVLTEQSPAGSGFLADVVTGWEASTQPARDAGIRVVNLRFGMILSPRDGALAKMLTPFKLGGGGRVGSGKQYWSWISIDDAVGAVHHAMMSDSLSGPVNAVAPNPVTNAEFTKTLGRVLNRPTIFPVPAFAAKLGLGEMANELLLPSQRVEPSRLLETDYEFRQPTLEGALRHVLGKTK